MPLVEATAIRVLSLGTRYFRRRTAGQKGRIKCPSDCAASSQLSPCRDHESSSPGCLLRASGKRLRDFVTGCSLKPRAPTPWLRLSPGPELSLSAVGGRAVARLRQAPGLPRNATCAHGTACCTAQAHAAHALHEVGKGGKAGQSFDTSTCLRQSEKRMQDPEGNKPDPCLGT